MACHETLNGHPPYESMFYGYHHHELKSIGILSIGSVQRKLGHREAYPKVHPHLVFAFDPKL